MARAVCRLHNLLWWRRRPRRRKFSAKQLPKQQRRQPERSTSKDRCDSPAPDQHDGNTPPNQRKPVKPAVRGVSEVSRALFHSPPPPLPPSPPLPPPLPPRIFKQARCVLPMAADVHVVEAVQQEDLHQLELHLPLLDVRLLNSIINKRVAALEREHAVRMLKMHASYTKRLAAYNPTKWCGINEMYENRISVSMAARSRAHCRV